MILKKLKIGSQAAAAEFTPKKMKVKRVTKLGAGFHGN